VSLFHQRIQSSEVSLGHSYNLIETKTRRIFNVETASRKRISVYEVGEVPFFHANMYLHLPINQASDTKQNPVLNLFDPDLCIPNHMGMFCCFEVSQFTSPIKELNY